MKLIILLLLTGSLLANPVINSARLSEAVYEKKPQTTLTLLTQHENKFFGNKLMAFYDAKTDSVYIAIRGTDKISNWISNAHIAQNILDAAAQRLLSLSHHRYYDLLKKGNQDWFISAFEDLEKASSKILSKHPNTKFIFTGHSYGGLMANLLAQSAYAQNPYLDFECHTFNAPGAEEIRENSLEMQPIPKKILRQHFFNHIRLLDP